MSICDDLHNEGYVKGTPDYRREYGRRYYHLNPGTQDKQYARLVQRRYGLSPEQVTGMFEACGFKCQCCGTAVLPAGQGHAKKDVGNIDHDHATGKVRGVLCNPCNQALGLLKDNPQMAVAYLERTR